MNIFQALKIAVFYVPEHIDLHFKFMNLLYASKVRRRGPIKPSLNRLEALKWF